MREETVNKLASAVAEVRRKFPHLSTEQALPLAAALLIVDSIETLRLDTR